MSLINQPMILIGNQDSIYLPFEDITPDTGTNAGETIIDVYTYDNDPIDRTLIHGLTRSCTFVQAGNNSYINSDPDSTLDLDLNISAYSTAYSGYPTDIIALEFTGIDSTILEGITSLSMTAIASTQHAGLTIAGYVGTGMPSTDDAKWKEFLYELDITETGSVNISGNIACHGNSDGKLYLKIKNRSKVDMENTNSMNFVISNLSITTKTRHVNPNLYIL